MGTDILKDWPTASAFEARLAQMGIKVIAGGELDSMLRQYSEARAALARERLVDSAKATGFALATVAADLPREAARLAREAYEKLTAVLG
jgi:hypothetical protein